MEKRILEYIDKINKMLYENDLKTDWNEVLSDHLNQISFFQHERLIHLIVTVTFGILLVMIAALLLLINEFNKFIFIFILFIIIAVMLVLYIRHYYYLENSVQKLYEQYDEVLLKKHHQEHK